MNYTKHIEGVICVTDGKFPTDSFVFSGPRLPEPGEMVMVTMNGLGPASVLGYRPVEGTVTEKVDGVAINSGRTMYVGLIVRFQAPPKWFVTQNGGNVDCIIFGADIDWSEG